MCVLERGYDCPPMRVVCVCVCVFMCACVCALWATGRRHRVLAQGSLGEALLLQGRFAEARAELTAAVAGCREAYGPTIMLARSLSNLAHALQVMGGGGA